MSEQDRGAYAPPNDAPLTFDPRHDGDRRGPAPLALIVSVLILIAIVAGLVVFYRHGVRKPGQPPQVVGAPIGDTKSAPLSSEAPSDATAGLQVYKTEQTPPGEGQTQAQPSLAPAPEEPQARPIARPPAPAPVAVAPLRAAEPAPAAPAPVKQVAVAKPPPVAAPAVVQPPAPKPAPVQAASAPKPVKPPKPAPAAVAQAAAKPTPAAPAGAILAQIGAFSSSALAEKGWSDAAHAAPKAMSGRSRKIEVTSRDGKTFYRALAGGFASKADAEKFCAALHAAHTVCIVK
ncbi:MAG TPA: SPOR domain-containing protein [Caulobacteraceae bacterium]